MGLCMRKESKSHRRETDSDGDARTPERQQEKDGALGTGRAQWHRGASRAVRLVGCLATPRAVRPKGGAGRTAGQLGQSGDGKAREPVGPVTSAAGKKNQSPNGTVEAEQAAVASSQGAEKQTADRTLEPEQAALVTSVVKQSAGRTRKPRRAAPKNVKGNLDFLVDSGSAVHVVPPEAARWGRLRRDLLETRMVDVQGNDIDRLGATDLDLKLEGTGGGQRAKVTA